MDSATEKNAGNNAFPRHVILTNITTFAALEKEPSPRLLDIAWDPEVFFGSHEAFCLTHTRNTQSPSISANIGSLNSTMAPIDYLLHESSTGYSVFKVTIQADSANDQMTEWQEGTLQLDKFGKMVKVVCFVPFENTAQALENANSLSEGSCSDLLKETLEANLLTAGKEDKSKVTLGVADKALAGIVMHFFPNIECNTGEASEVVVDLLRGLRQHAPKLLRQAQEVSVSTTRR